MKNLKPGDMHPVTVKRGVVSAFSGSSLGVNGIARKLALPQSTHRAHACRPETFVDESKTVCLSHDAALSAWRNERHRSCRLSMAARKSANAR